MYISEVLLVVCCAGIAALIAAAFMQRQKPERQTAPEPKSKGLSFLFRDFDLEHASPEGAALLSSFKAETDLHALRASLLPRFPDFPTDAEIDKIEAVTVPASDPRDKGVVCLTRDAEMIRVEISDDAPGDMHTLHTIRTLQARAETLEVAAEGAPYPIWTLDKEGSLSWHNKSYAQLSERFGVSSDNQPVFDTSALERTGGGSARSAITSTRDGRDTWYDVNVAKTRSGVVCHAVDINAVIQAEIAQRNFVQTLAKTFAQLSIGLAIFDRNGQLALFNPALVDLTSLPVEFLSARPELLSFFDRLRDNRVMPEPKNYMTWRHEFTDLITAATNSSYEETWNLDSGHTYRITGRPHPDGALAFLIEDITAEISLTRNFRAEIEIGQSIIDSLEDGFVVFSSTGVLTYCNLAYREMWKLDPENSFADVTIIDSSKAWQSDCVIDPTFSDIHAFVLQFDDRTPWSKDVRHNDGRVIRLHLSPITGGATLIRFSVLKDTSVRALA